MKRTSLVLLLLCFFVFGCGESSTPTKANDFGGIKEIELFPEYQPLANNTMGQMRAIAFYYDEPSRDVTDEVVWSSQNEGIATISSSGMVEAKTAGNVLITATLEGQRGDIDYEIVNAEILFIAVVPMTITLQTGSSQQFIAYGTFADVTEQFTQDISTSVDWFIADSGVAVIDQTGLASAAGAGTVDVEASFDTVVGLSELTVE